MSTKVIQGRNCRLKIVYNNVPYTFRFTKFDESDDAELRKRSLLGRVGPEVERIGDGYSGSLTTLHDGPTLDAIVADMDARERDSLPPKPLVMTLTEVFRDGVTVPSTLTYQGLAITVSKSAGSRTDDVTRDVKWQSESRVFA